MEKVIRLAGHVPGEMARRDPYVYLPFEVPVGARRIEVSYSYGEPSTAVFAPGNSVDIGLFDSRGRDFPVAAGFRGWSGTARREFFVAEDEATPGYIKGALFPGEWNVILGCAQLEPEGVSYEVDVRVLSDSPRDDSPRSESSSLRDDKGSFEYLRTSGALGASIASADVASVGQGRWLKGDLHCHTLHSDGANTVEEMVGHAVELGLDFLAITDHNTNSHHAEMDALSDGRIVLIPGEEVTTYWGHANTWGLREWVDFRCYNEDTMRSLLDHVTRRGAMLSINHAKCIGPPWLFKGWEGFPAMEVWQAPWRFYNFDSLEKWDGLLQRGERVVALGGSDVHSVPPADPRHPHGLAEPTTWVYANEASEGGVLAAIRAARTYVTDSPRSPVRVVLLADEDGDGRFQKLMGDEVAPERVRFRAEVTAGREKRLWVVTDAGTLDIVPIEQDDAVVEFTVDMGRHKYVRLELRGWRGRRERGEVVWALSNPIWRAR
jgi:hypothetical protein